MLLSGKVLKSSCKNLVMIDGLLNENSELKKKKKKKLIFNFHTISHSLIPRNYYDALHHSKGLGISYFLVYHMYRYLIYKPRYDRFSTTGPNHVFSSPL